MDELLTVKEVAARLKVNPQTVRRWIRTGRLPAVRYGARAWRVRNGDVRPRFEAPPPPTPEELERRRKALYDIFALREKLAPQGVAEPSLQEILDESDFELETRGEVIRRPPPLTPEQAQRQKVAMEKLQAIRSVYGGQGPTLQELLDERRRELEV